MTTKQEAEDWKQGKDLARQGWDAKPAAIRLHGSGETPKHLLIKSLIARELQQRGRRWDTEVRGPEGRADVLDFGPTDGKAVVYEVQTGCTPKDRRKKARQYAGGPVRDVLFLDPEEAPDDIAALTEWVSEQVVG